MITQVPYEGLVEGLIRRKYSISDEMALMRQRYTKPEEFEEYFNYCEQCKEEAKTMAAEQN